VHSIDLKSILEDTVSARYGDLVTRNTGRAVRGGIEQVLAQNDGQQTTVIDFTDVGCLDISCADEIVGKLLLTHGRGRYFLLRGVTEAHCEAIDMVLERHGLAAVALDRDGQLGLLGPLPDTTRRAFDAVARNGRVGADQLAVWLDLPTEATRQALDELLELRLVQQEAGGYRALSP
jgi:anti-anti-sigma regulatory factor